MKARRKGKVLQVFAQSLVLLFMCCFHLYAAPDDVPGVFVNDILDTPAAGEQIGEAADASAPVPRKLSGVYADAGIKEAGTSPASSGSKTSDEYGDVTAKDVEDVSAGTEKKPSDEYGDVTAEEPGPKVPHVADPIKPWNVAMYHFNDKLYFWLWKPAATGYKYAVPEEVRGLIGNFYENLKAPIRIFNNLLQGEPGYAGIELVNLVINSTLGVGGLKDCAKECFGINGRYADFGQTLGKYGVGFGFYLVLPFLGPSSVRDGIGSLVDWSLRPTTWISTEFFSVESLGLYAHERINGTSFHLGEYEALKAAAIDPYVAMRDIYIQYRVNLIKNK